MWTVPTTPESNNFVIDPVRRDISSARLIEVEKPIEGKIRDGNDTDYYRINSGKATRLEIHIHKSSPTLIPAVRVYNTAKNIIGERGEESLHPAGTDLEYSFLAQPNTTYYFQVWSQRNMTGAYTLTVRGSRQ
jgi:hypothetical protein